jgi:ketol-acid reductoisomerase
MEKGTKDIYSEQELSSKSIVELLEEIRLTSLNLAISSAKFKAYNLRQNQIKKDLSEMVALALEAVQILSNGGYQKRYPWLGQNGSGS